MNSQETLGVALPKELCPSCRKELDGPIVMNKGLSVSAANNVKKLHGQVIGFADNFCEECETNISKGFIAVIVIDPSKSDLNAEGNIVSQENEYRIAHLFVKKKPLIDIFGKDLDKYIRNNMLRIDEETFKACGLEEAYLTQKQ